MSVRLEPAQRAAAEQAWHAAAALLESGAQGAGLVLVGEVLRAVHSCRLAGLPRIANAGVRVAQEVRDLHAQRPEFRLAALTASVFELLATGSTLLGCDEVSQHLIGVARRAYADIGVLHLSGLFTEPIVSTSGYAGVVTYLVDESGMIWSLGDVAPGGAERCQFAYVTPLDVGEVAAEHRALSRQGLRLEHASAAANRRLGSGRGVGAAIADGARWEDAPLAGLWNTSLEAQVQRAWAARERLADERVAGDDLLFVRGTVIGARDDALELLCDGLVLRAIAPSAHRELAYRHNLRVLANARGASLLVVGRIAFARPRTLQLLAIGGTTVHVREEWNARVNLGLDRLGRDEVRSAGPYPEVGGGVRAQREEVGVDPLDPLERRLQQVLLGGRTALSPSTWSGYRRDERALAQRQLATAAQLLRALRSVATEPADAATRQTRLAQAWLAGRTYLGAARAHLQRGAWLR